MVLNAKDPKVDDAKRKKLARSYATRLRALLRQAVARGNKGAARMYRVWRDMLKQMAKSQLDQADHAWLALTADDLGWWGYDPPNDTYDAACFLSRCVTLATKDAKLPETKRKELAQSYADRALALLGKAVARGFKNAASMKKDPNL